MMAPPAIHNAAFWGKIDDLRAELAEGVSPDLAYSEEWSDFDDTGPRAFTMTPLHYLIDSGGFNPNEEQLDSLLVCLGLLLAAGANPNLEQVGGRDSENIPQTAPGFLRTPLQLAMDAPGPWTPRFAADFVFQLLEAGADVNARGSQNLTALHTAARKGSIYCAPLLIDAGANINALSSNGSTPLDTAFASADEYMHEASVRAGGKGTTAFERGARNCHRVATILLRADARTAVYPTADISDPYARRVLGAGGFKKYERAHLAALTATFAPKLPALPADAVRVVVAFCFHVGYY